MRKIFLFMMTSVDGFFEGKDHDLSWHNVDEDFNSFAVEQLAEADLLLFGRKTYQLFEDYWPNAPKDPNISSADIKIAEAISNLPKIVFSKTLDKVTEKENWKNIRLRNRIDTDEIKKLKAAPGKNIVIYGSNNLVVNLIEEKLVDEVRIIISPVVINEGTKLFYGLDKKLDLKFASSRNFKNGNVLNYYKLHK